MALRTVTCIKRSNRGCATFIHRSIPSKPAMGITTLNFPVHRNDGIMRINLNLDESLQNKFHCSTLASSFGSLKSFQPKFGNLACLYLSTTSNSNHSNEQGNIDKEVIHVLRFDGAVSKSPPYKAGAGILLYHASSGEEVLSTSHYFGANQSTLIPNENDPEFSAGSVQNSHEFEMYINAIVAQGKSLLLGMQYAKDMGIKNLIVQGHSPLIHFYNENGQNNNSYQPKNKDVQIIYEKIQNEIKALNFDSFEMFIIEKENNKDALDLAQRAIYVSKGTDDENDINQEGNLDPELSTLSFSNDKSNNNSDNEQSILDLNILEHTLERKNEIDVTSPEISIETETNHISQKTDAKVDTKKTYILQFDGGSRGNPGIAGAGYTIYDSSPFHSSPSSSSNTNIKEVKSGSYFVGFSSTNNEAEYLALIKGLECCQKLGIKHVIAQGDSALVVNQVNKAWKCKKQNLQKLLQDVNEIIDIKGRDSKEIKSSSFQSFQIQHIPRELNRRADELANEAMDRKA